MEAVVTKKPHLTIKATSGWAALNLSEVWHFRDLLFTLAGRDVRLRYRQTAMGVSWVILQPVMAAGLFTMVFDLICGMKAPPGVPSYFVFTYAGLLGWNIFFNTIGKVATSMVGNAQLVSKVYFPRVVLPLSTIFSTLIDFGVALVLMVVLLFVYKINPGPGIFLLPVYICLFLMMSVGLGLIAAALMVSYRDVQYILPVALQMMMYASPVMYVITKIPVSWRWAYMLNPLAGLVLGFRSSLLGETEIPNQSIYLLYSAACAVLVFVWGMFSFKRMERKFADVI
jgi:lipopolysaccharide transport system permease protein